MNNVQRTIFLQTCRIARKFLRCWIKLNSSQKFEWQRKLWYCVYGDDDNDDDDNNNNNNNNNNNKYNMIIIIIIIIIKHIFFGPF